MLISAANLIGQGWNNYRRYLRYFLPYIFLLIITGAVVFLAGYIGIETELHLKASRLINDVIILLIYVVSMIFSIWITIGLIQTAAAAWKNQGLLHWKEALINNNHLIIPIIVNSILVTLLITLGSILFIIPGIIFFVWYNFTSYAIILDNKTWKNAFAASKSLVIGRWWNIAWRILAIIVAYTIISTVIQFGIAGIVGYIRGVSATTIEVINNSLASLINIILTPPLIISLVGLYQSAKENQTPTTDTAPTTL
jgi:hypothetical protein